MKAVLVIDMPKNCAECKLIHLQGIEESICNVVDWEERPSWCPIKPLPETKDIGYPNDDYDVGFGDGWDACLKEITE